MPLVRLANHFASSLNISVSRTAGISYSTKSITYKYRIYSLFNWTIKEQKRSMTNWRFLGMLGTKCAKNDPNSPRRLRPNSIDAFVFVCTLHNSSMWTSLDRLCMSNEWAKLVVTLNIIRIFISSLAYF